MRTWNESPGGNAAEAGADGKAGTAAKGGTGMSMADRGKEGAKATAKAGADGKADGIYVQGKTEMIWPKKGCVLSIDSY